jgi:hypothetical protein
MKNIILIIILTLTFHGLAYAGSRAPAILISPEVWDLGQVPVEKEYSKVFRIYNNGNALLTVDKVRPSCGCTTTHLSTSEALAGSSISFEAWFRTGTISGEVERKIYVHSNDPQKPISLIKIIADVFLNK